MIRFASTYRAPRRRIDACDRLVEARQRGIVDRAPNILVRSDFLLGDAQ
jgi:hypothetical protein